MDIIKRRSILTGEAEIINNNNWQIKFVKYKKQKTNCAYVYFILVDDVIKKIGGTKPHHGIKSALRMYQYGMSGNPGQSRFIIYQLILRSLQENKKVEFFSVVCQKTKVVIKGFYSTVEREITSYQETEQLFLKEYKEINQSFPEWNFKENNKKYPKQLAKDYARFKTKISQ